MRFVISPYHLTRRDPAAMAAMLLARDVVTLLPTTRESTTAREAFSKAGRVQTFREFMRAWAWSEPLWINGVVTPAHSRHSPLDELLSVGNKITSDPTLEPLRRFTPDQFYEDDERFVGALAADLLKGGADPGVCVAVAAAMDRFAARHALTAVRGIANSLVERRELRESISGGSMIVPIFVQASAQRILHAREVLSDVLQAWWDADEVAHLENASPWALPAPMRLTSTRQQVAAYAAAFEARRDELFEGASDDDVRAIEGAATVTWLTFRSDNSLRCSLDAMMELARPARPSTAPDPTIRTTPSTALAAPADPLDAAPVGALMIKALGVSPTNANHSLGPSKNQRASKR